MPSTYTTSLRLTLPATGELAGTWGTTVNAGVTSLAEAAIAGTAAVTMIDADYTLTAVNGAADQARNMFVTLTGTLSTARNVICPPVSKLYFVTNNTTGGYAITFKTLAGTGISVPNGQRAVVYCNGTDVLGGLTALDSLSLNGSLTLVGGTANGVAYLNGSKALTTGSALTFNGTNLGVGVTSPSQKLDILGGIAVRAATSGANQDIIALRALNSDNTAYANAIYYANSHRWAYAGATEGMRLDSSGNLGLGVTPSAWSTLKGFDISSGGALFGYTAQVGLANNAYFDGSSWRYKNTDAAAFFRANALGFEWHTAPSGTAGNTITFTQAMTLDASGNLGLGVTPVGHLPSAYGGPAFQIGARSTVLGSTNLTELALNTYYATGFWRYIGTGIASSYRQDNGAHAWYTAPSGTAGNPISFTQAMTLDASGNLGVGKTPSLTQLQVKQSTTYAFGIDNSNETQNYSWRVDTGAGNPLILGTRTTSTDLLWLSAAGNLGLGVTPSAWSANAAFQIGAYAAALSSISGTDLSFSAYYNGGWKYQNSTYAPTLYSQSLGTHAWYTAPSGTAGNAISFTQAMTINSSGNLGLGVTPSAWGSDRKILQLGGATYTYFAGNGIANILSNNVYVDSGGTSRYLQSYAAGFYQQNGNGDHYWYTAPSGTAGNAITFTQAMTLDASGNLGLGVTPSAWGGGGFKAFQVGPVSQFYDGGTGGYWLNNTYYNSGAKYITAGAATQYLQASGVHSWHTAPSGTAGNAISFTQAMTLDASGNLGVGTASPTSTLHVSGSFSRGVPVTKTTNFTLAATENWVIVDNSTSSVTATLPAPSSFPGRELMFVARYATGGGNLVSASSNVVQPDGTVTNVIIPYDVAGRYKSSTIVSDGTNWVVMNRGIM